MIKIYFDGACSNNSDKVMGIGVSVLNTDMKEIHYHSGKLGIGTSNVAEWMALTRALEIIEEKLHNEKLVMVLGDSQLIVNQFNGDFAVKNQGLKLLYENAISIANRLKKKKIKVVVAWIPREKNQRADELSKLALTNSNFI